MKRQELLKMMDHALLEKLFGFCYARTRDSYEAQELSSDIIFAWMEAAGGGGEVKDAYPFLWRVARNVYSDFCKDRSLRKSRLYEGDPEPMLLLMEEEEKEDDTEMLQKVYRQISFLTKAYREAMILFYLDGLSIAQIAERQGTSEVAIRQRLFSARKKIREEVEKMEENYNKPMVLDDANFVIWGTGQPGWGDPREVCTRRFSHHVVLLCHKKPRSAVEIAKELNVPTIYVEEELEILAKGKNGEYGLLRRLDNGKYAINFIFLDKDEIQKAHEIYKEQIPNISRAVLDFLNKKKKEYLAFPFLNRKVDWNLILWQQIKMISSIFSWKVNDILSEKYFAGVEEKKRPFLVYGYLDYGKGIHGGGVDGAYAEELCGYSKVLISNLYTPWTKMHFSCNINAANDPQIRLAVHAIRGLCIHVLSEEEKEWAAKAVECGYLYRENENLYTKILVSDMKDNDRLFAISYKFFNGYLEAEAEAVAEKIYRLIHKNVPDYLMEEWRLVNDLAELPVLDSLLEFLIQKGVMTPPEGGIGAEGCWMSVEK